MSNKIHGCVWPFQASPRPCQANPPMATWGHSKQARSHARHAKQNQWLCTAIAKQAHGCMRPFQVSPWLRSTIPSKAIVLRSHAKRTMIQAIDSNKFDQNLIRLFILPHLSKSLTRGTGLTGFEKIFKNNFKSDFTSYKFVKVSHLSVQNKIALGPSLIMKSLVLSSSSKIELVCC